MLAECLRIVTEDSAGLASQWLMVNGKSLLVFAGSQAGVWELAENTSIGSAER